MSEHWKKHDRPCPPCTDCGAECAKNGLEVQRLTDECADKGIILVPNGENL